jgi:hypothetical protein
MVGKGEGKGKGLNFLAFDSVTESKAKKFNPFPLPYHIHLLTAGH